MNQISYDEFICKVANFEGFRSKPYVCSAGFLTVGYGHRTTDRSLTLTVEHARELLRDDMAICISYVKSVFHFLSYSELYAIADLVFNVGRSKVCKSNLWQQLHSLNSLRKSYNALGLPDVDSFPLYKDSNLAFKTAIGNNLLTWCHYHDKQGKICTSKGLLLRCQFRKGLFLLGK